MWAFWRAATPRQKLRKRIDKLWRKGRHAEAVALQHQLCQSASGELQEWQTLLTMATEALLPDVALTARLAIATLEHVGPTTWNDLADAAASIGRTDDEVRARFHAADAAACLGDCRLAVELCDKVLELKPEHGAARRIRELMVARLEPPRPADEVWSEEGTLPFPGGAAFAPAPLVIEASHQDPDADETLTSWPPARPVTAEIARLSTPQTWPTVLDDHSLLFARQEDALPAEDLSEPLHVEAGAVVFEQGKVCDLLYRLERGIVRVRRQRDEMQELGVISAPALLGEIGALSNLVATTRVEAVGECTLRVITRAHLRLLMQQDQAKAKLLVESLKSLYLDAVFRISPLFVDCTSDEFQILARSWRWITIASGQRIVEVGASTDPHVIVTGMAEVTAESQGKAQPLGLAVPGDLVAEIAPSPVTVTARRTVHALVVDRRVLAELPARAQATFRQRAERCRHVSTVARDPNQRMS
jgi:CRP-like cAMP-binding protein